MTSFTVESPNVRYTHEHIESDYSYQTTKVEKNGQNIKVISTEYYLFFSHQYFIHDLLQSSFILGYFA